MRLELTRTIAAPPAVVWSLLTAWERQPEWMVDAQAVHVLTPQRTGEGVTIRCPTTLFGITVQDVMRVTRWEEAAHLEVVHLGRIITGRAAFELAAGAHATTLLTWWEEVTPPLGRPGEWGASTLALPLLRRLFTRSLSNLAALAEADAGTSVT